MNEFLLVREKTSYVSSNIKNDVNLIKSFYRSLGFYFVKIDAEIQQLEKNRVNIIYSIDKGEKAKISKIYFLGDKKIRDKKLADSPPVTYESLQNDSDFINAALI